MGLQTYDGRDVRIQQAGRSYADVVQLSGAAVRARRARQAAVQDEPYTVHQVSTLFNILAKWRTSIIEYVLVRTVSL